MANDFDPQPAALLLTRAWYSGQQLQALPAEIRPRTLREGYDIQDRLIESLDEKVVGWKLGVGSHKGKRESGIGRSIAGRILKRQVYRNGDAIALPNDAPVTIEFEVAFVLARDIEP